jgi:hypothetical protein
MDWHAYCCISHSGDAGAARKPFSAPHLRDEYESHGRPPAHRLIFFSYFSARLHGKKFVANLGASGLTPQ